MATNSTAGPAYTGTRPAGVDPDAAQETSTWKGSELHRVAQCMLNIETNPVHRKALKVATSDANISAARIKELMSKSEEMKKNIFQVVGFFLAFQSFLITVVGQSSILRKDNLWSPLVLSTVVGVACFIPVWQYGMAIANLRGNICVEENIHKVAEKARNELRRLGTSYSFPAAEHPKWKKRSTCYYFLPSALVLLFLICFTLLILISEWRILSSAP